MGLLSWKLGWGGVGSGGGLLVRPGMPEGQSGSSLSLREGLRHLHGQEVGGGWEGKMAPACAPVDAHITTLSLEQTLNMPTTCSHLH